MDYYAITIEADSTPTIFDSKIGGLPYWTPEQAFPVDSAGRKMYLLAQINFETFEFDLPLPSTGILQFYISDDDLMGVDYDNQAVQKNFRVIYHEKIDSSVTAEILNSLEIPTAADSENCLPIYREFKISFSKAAEDGEEKFPAHKILGKPYFTQDDPRTDDSEFDTLLLQIDSEGEFVMWGDAGVGNFFINRRDLLAKNFSRVLYNWDCC